MRFKNDFPDEREPFTWDKFLDKLPRILSLVLAAVAVVVLVSGLIAFLIRHDKAGQNYRKTDPSVQKVINQSRRRKENVEAYTNLGQMRLALRNNDDGTTSLLVVSPWFSYPEGDTAFEEELSKKERQIKAVISDYFASYTKDELLKKGEDTIKSELKSSINDQLVLNKIVNIYFDEYVYF